MVTHNYTDILFHLFSREPNIFHVKLEKKISVRAPNLCLTVVMSVWLHKCTLFSILVITVMSFKNIFLLIFTSYNGKVKQHSDFRCVVMQPKSTSLSFTESSSILLPFFHMFSCSSTSFTGNHVHKKCGQHTALEVKPAEKQGWKTTHPLVQG